MRNKTQSFIDHWSPSKTSGSNVSGLIGAVMLFAACVIYAVVTIVYALVPVLVICAILFTAYKMYEVNQRIVKIKRKYATDDDNKIDWVV